MSSPPGRFGLEPWDEHNQALVAQVHPPGWVNPQPAAGYHLVVIGGGTAGLVCAAGAAGLGAKVALVERHLLGGDCLNTGCVPSKTLLSAARAAGADFGAAMSRVRETRAVLAPHDSAARFAGLGVDVFLGDARFDSERTIAVGGARLHFGRAVIATGARAMMPSIPGLADARPLTSETVFNLTGAPRRLAIIGGGRVGCELAQAFARLGTRVVVLHDGPHVLDQEDPEAAAVVEDALTRDSVTFVLGARIRSVASAGAAHTIHVEAGGVETVVEVDALLVAAGRKANVEGLGLDAAGVQCAANGDVLVDDFLRTTNPRVYGCGDVAMRWKFTHAADAAARIVIQNALFARGPLGRRRLSDVNMSWCTYTDPEVAQVGLSVRDAQEAGIDVDTYRQSFSSIDRAVTDADTRGFVKILTRRGTGVIVGATIVASRAGDMIGELAVAMAGKVGLGALAAVVHPYPTYAEAVRRCGDDYNRTRLTPRVKRLLEWLLRT